MAGALAITACGEVSQATVSGGVGGVGGAPYQVCTLGLCVEDEALATSCQDVYDACVGQGHYTRCCRMDADRTCGVFGQTGPY